MINGHLFDKPLTTESLLQEAIRFAGSTHHIGDWSGPVIGERVQNTFYQFLQDAGYDIESKGPHRADFTQLNVDLKTCQTKGDRGGSAKIHGYSRGGSPTYDLLIFFYSYGEKTIEVEKVLFVPSDEINWTQAEHYLWSLPDDRLVDFEIK